MWGGPPGPRGTPSSRRIRRPTSVLTTDPGGPASHIKLSRAGFNGLAVAEINLDKFLAGRDARYYFFCRGIYYRAAIGIGILTVQTKRDPARMRLLLRIVKDCDA